MKYIVIYAVVMNSISFFMYGLDKWKAKNNAWRISEKTLLLLAFLGGSVGALAGMHMFRHKTKHKLFVLGIPVCLILHIALVYWGIR